MPAFKVIKAALQADGNAWASALAGGLWRQKARILKRDGAFIVYRARLLERDVVIKLWPMTPKARLQALFANTRSLRHWRGAARLRKCGIPTAWTWAALRGTLDGRPAECLVMEALRGRTALQHLADNNLTIREQHAVAEAIGRQIAQLAAAMLFNRDHKPSNLIVTDTAPGSAAVAVIDCVDIRRGQFRPDRMMAMLLIEALGVGLRPRLAIRMRIAHACTRAVPENFEGGPRQWLRDAWHRTDRLVRAHGDPTPRINPLGAERS